MIITSQQTFPAKIKHLSNQIKFGQTNLPYLPYIINREVIEFAKDNEWLHSIE